MRAHLAILLCIGFLATVGGCASSRPAASPSMLKSTMDIAVVSAPAPHFIIIDEHHQGYPIMGYNWDGSPPAIDPLVFRADDFHGLERGPTIQFHGATTETTILLTSQLFPQPHLLLGTQEAWLAAFKRYFESDNHEAFEKLTI